MTDEDSKWLTIYQLLESSGNILHRRPRRTVGRHLVPIPETNDMKTKRQIAIAKSYCEGNRDD